MNRSFIYIIKSESNQKYYIGACKNPLSRIQEHNRGKTQSTRNKGPWQLKFIQEFSSFKEAKQMEYRVKKLKRRDYIEKIIKDGYIRAHSSAG